MFNGALIKHLEKQLEKKDEQIVRVMDMLKQEREYNQVLANKLFRAFSIEGEDPILAAARQIATGQESPKGKPIPEMDDYFS